MEIVNDTIHSIFPEISATERENGFVRYVKIFVKNESTTRTMKDCIFYIKQDVVPPDRIKLFESMQNPSISFNITNELLGTSSAIAAGTSIAIDSILPNTLTTSDLNGRAIEILGVTYNINGAPDTSHVTLAEDVSIDIVAGYSVTTSDDFDTYQDAQDFIAGKGYVNSIIKSTIATGVTEVFIPMVDKNLFSAGDAIVMVDGYFRAVYRGEILDVVDHGTDPEIAIVSLDKAYTSMVSIPSNEGYLCSGIKRTLSPGEGQSFWLELGVSSSDAIDAEVINQFQLGTHFDDITFQ